MMNKLEEFFIEEIYVSILGKKENKKHVLFIHGGPGLNSQSLCNYLLASQSLNNLDANIVFYDQRGCGKSSIGKVKNNYEQQIIDLEMVVKHLPKFIKLAGIIGHSYGAKLLSDFQKNAKLQIPLIFLSTAKNIDVPRQNNIKLDLEYLRESDPKKHEEIVNKLDRLSLWDISLFLASTFSNNPHRMQRYWYNEKAMTDYLEISKNGQYPMNNEVFESLRAELYNSKNKDVLIDGLNSYLLIGLHDYIMEGSKVLANDKTVIFENSSHYPHLEEAEKFCKVVNEII